MLPLLLALYAGEDETDLIARLQRRDPQALAELYDRYGRTAYSLILRMVRDKSIAEDLVQETFLRVWNRVHTIDSAKGAIGPWLLAIARNGAIDYLRSSAGRERNAVELDEAGHAPLYGEMEADILISDQARRVAGHEQPGSKLSRRDGAGLFRGSHAIGNVGPNGTASGHHQDLGARGLAVPAR
jgi:RNA polymerase sigma-70 factor (ECF subfamily)